METLTKEKFLAGNHFQHSDMATYFAVPRTRTSGCVQQVGNETGLIVNYELVDDYKITFTMHRPFHFVGNKHSELILFADFFVSTRQPNVSATPS